MPQYEQSDKQSSEIYEFHTSKRFEFHISSCKILMLSIAIALVYIGQKKMEDNTV
jgi:hypothetical protein